MYADVCGIHVCPKGVSILYDVAVCDSFSDSSFSFSEKRRKRSEKMMQNGHDSYVAPGFHELLHTSQAICSSYLLLHSTRITSGFPKMVVPNNHGFSY